VEYGKSSPHSAGWCCIAVRQWHTAPRFFLYWIMREQIRCSEYEVQTLFLEINLVIGLVSC
jgi:hypothetical protein